MKNKASKHGQLGFHWIFAIIIGAVILFLAIFTTSRYINLQRYKYDTELAAQLSTLLNPLETGFETGTKISLPLETRMQLTCQYSGIGREDLRVATKSSVGAKWQEYGATQNIYNKYLFSRYEEGRVIYVFSKPFEMPFRIGDLIYVMMSDYCFVDAPDSILSELEDLNMSNIQLANRQSECKKTSRTVCFGNSGCNLNVFGQCYSSGCPDLYDYGIVEIRGEKVELLYYAGMPLLYAALFSDSDLYKCNLQRLMYRIILVSKLYAEKAKLLDARGCNTGKMAEKLATLATQASYLTKADNIQPILDFAKQVDDANKGILCHVY